VNRPALAALAFTFALAHVPFLAASLEDVDSVNFALGIRDFDVAAHRPHPPGYPLYIAIGKVGTALARPWSDDATAASMIEARTLSIVSLCGAVVAILLLYRVLACFSRSDRDPLEPPWQRFDARALAATSLAVTCPLFWYLAVRPMSDVPGLAAAIGAQACLALAWWRQQPGPDGDRRLPPDRIARSGQMIVLGSLLSAIAIGFRAQNALLTLPLLVTVLIDRIGRGVAGALVGSAVAAAAGVLTWAVPTVVATGGWNAYLAALGSQAGEDFAGVDMLYLNPNARLAAHGLLRTFVYPWDSLVLGGIVVSLAAVGAAALVIRDRRSLVAIIAVTVPYLAFHLLFQDTTFVRYALPLVPPVAFLALCGLEFIVRRAALPVTGVLALWAVGIAAPVLAAYGSESSPTVRSIEAMHGALDASRPGALAMHHTFRRPLEAEHVAIEPRLAAPPRREWLELVRYWHDGNTAPLWFLADPRRTDLALIDPRSRMDRFDFAWRFSSLSQIGGMRPAAVTWLRMQAPGWFAEEGWALTPETAGMARLMGRGPALGPITAWIRRRDEATRMLIGGRHLGPAGEPQAVFYAAIDGAEVARWQTPSGFFLREVSLGAGVLSGAGPLARLTLWSEGSDGGRPATAIEQFDLQSQGSLMWAYDTGWHESEYEPELGIWRWMPERAVLQIVDATTPIAIAIRVDPPRRYFDDDPVVRVTAADRLLGTTNFRDSQILSVTVPLDALHAAAGRVVIETNRTFVPAERGEGQDRRVLGLRVFAVDVVAQH